MTLLNKKIHTFLKNYRILVFFLIPFVGCIYSSTSSNTTNSSDGGGTTANTSTQATTIQTQLQSSELHRGFASTGQQRTSSSENFTMTDSNQESLIDQVNDSQ